MLDSNTLETADTADDLMVMCCDDCSFTTTVVYDAAAHSYAAVRGTHRTTVRTPSDSRPLVPVP